MFFKRCIFFLIMIGMPWLGWGQNWNYAWYDNGALGWADPITLRAQLYTAASTGNEEALQTILGSIQVDTPDQTGNSALCESVWRNDPRAFYLLRSYGATTDSV